MALDTEFVDTVEQGNAQLLIEILIENAAGQRFFEQQGSVEVQYLHSGRLAAILRLKQKFLEIHLLSPSNSFRSFLITRR